MYGMRAIFILFLTQALLFDKEHAASIGSYTGLVYLTPLIGGTLPTNTGVSVVLFLGSHDDGRRTVPDVLQRFHAGYRSTVALVDVWRPYFPYTGQRMLQADSIFLVGQLYEPGDRRLIALTHILYGVNVGSFLRRWFAAISAKP